MARPIRWICANVLWRGFKPARACGVARVLSISPSSVVKWSQRFRATGSAAAGKMGGHRPRLLVGAGRRADP
jgi:hypothetical protein